MNALGFNMAAEVPENPLIPPIPELVIGLIAFFIVFGFLAKKLLPNINKVLDERRKLIEGRMEDAEATQAEAQQVLADYRAQLADARHEAARLRQEAQEQGATLIAEMRAEGQRQREEIIAAGHAQIEADRKQAAQALRRDVGTLAVDLAGKIVGESLEEHARQSRTIDRFLDEVEGKAAAGSTKAEAGR
ncbi:MULTISPECIES: F0F1 ATP synthase subunit B [Streptomyces]|uniref:ATP synthase subunit b n=1 Tax=Streptomyces decoyicus TaxID=249567 RepID=A0ABZ1FG22_9ACTN|nr:MULTISPECIES: F0F1 ATP synthase subunit B [Streptomyces]KOG39370.1 ATP synthase F0F1 subunit B [Streptomyces decoyicus]MCL7492740.1 F0F1 ATP synthase subunit B [Streptomyces sp. MCA2]QZY18150.1 F0F1 ATP synthase subunit B [Streptomyces decoyicus]WSB68957.1 F0F1 ATP synthase subunit B [Streptomyces decoyicus]BDH14847.1 ATP synthase subunit b [Streptomyces hygroscopicus]